MLTERGKQCEGITKKGQQCTNTASFKTTRYCAKHQPLGEHIPSIVIDYNGKYVNGGSLTKQETANAPEIYFPSYLESSLFTLVMLDPDAPAAKVNGNQYLHWLVPNINLYHESLEATQAAYSYHGPNPPPGSGVHHYIFYALSQEKPINIPGNWDRTAFNLDKFISEYNLSDDDHAFFTVAS